MKHGRTIKSMELFSSDSEYLPKNDAEAELMLFAHAVEPFQEPNLRYHNWDEHIATSFQAAMDLCDTCEEHGVPVDRLVVGIAILGHDAGYSHYKSDKELKRHTGFDSREAYSTHITESILSSMGYDGEFIEEVSRSIMATKLNAPCDTTEQKIVRRADLHNIGGPFTGMFVNFLRLYKEGMELSGKPADPVAAIEQSGIVLERYMHGADLSLGEWDRDANGVCRFVNRALSNILQLKKTGEDFVANQRGS